MLHSYVKCPNDFIFHVKFTFWHIKGSYLSYIGKFYLRASWWKWKRRVKKLAQNSTFKKLRTWHLVPFSSVQFSRSVVSDSLRPHELQHARAPCPTPTPGVYSNSCPSSWWCHPAISSSVVPFSSCPQSLPESGSFPISQLIAWGGQSIGVSASASALPIIFRVDFL